MSFVHDGNPLEPREITAEHGTRIHLLDCAPGKLIVSYDATVIGRAEPASVSDYDVSKYLRPSRYAEADKFFGFVAGQFDLATPAAELLLEVTRWVSTHLSYVPGTSRGTDSAVDTLLAGAGVCRDYSHLTISLLRAVGIPARLVAVYAPGCDPMDFHAVVEANIDHVWRVVDATHWRRAAILCASRPAEMPQTQPSSTITAVRSRCTPRKFAQSSTAFSTTTTTQHSRRSAEKQRQALIWSAMPSFARGT